MNMAMMILLIPLRTAIALVSYPITIAALPFLYLNEPAPRMPGLIDDFKGITSYHLQFALFGEILIP